MDVFTSVTAASLMVLSIVFIYLARKIHHANQLELLRLEYDIWNSGWHHMRAAHFQARIDQLLGNE